MSSIPPGLPANFFQPQPAGQPPARPSRSDFFKAALDAVQGSPTLASPRSAAPQPSPAVSEDRPTRPGALLDIRV